MPLYFLVSCLYRFGCLGSGRVFSSGAADFGVNGSGMLVSSKVFKELEFFQGILSPVLLEAKRRVVEEHLQHLEKLRKSIEEKGTKKFHTFARPFETYQDTPEEMHYKSAPAGSPCLSVRAGVRFPKVMCGTYHCGLLTPDGALWVWGRNDCLQLGREKSVCHYRRFLLVIVIDVQRYLATPSPNVVC